MSTALPTAERAHHRPGSPWHLTWPEWKATLAHSWNETFTDNIDMMAAGVAFYAFLALVPLLGAIVLTYGLLATPASVIKDVHFLTNTIPQDAANLIGAQLLNVVTTSNSKKGVGLAMAMALALYGVRSGVGAAITALNVAYEEKETRSFLRFNGIVLAVAVTTVVFALVGIAAASMVARLQELMPTLSPVADVAEKAGSYVAIMVIGAAIAAALYRIAPCRHFTGWLWLTPGAAWTGIGWLLVTMGFGSYVANVGHYNVTYGSLGAVVVMLTWFYLSSFILLFGAQINSSCERQVDARKPAAAEGSSPR